MRGRAGQSLSFFHILEREGMDNGAESLKRDKVRQGCSSALEVTYLMHRRFLRASRTVAKTLICAVVDEVRIGRVTRWKRLVWVKYESQADKGLGSSPLLVHDANV